MLHPSPRKTRDTPIEVIDLCSDSEDENAAPPAKRPRLESPILVEEFVQGSSSGNAMCAPTYIESDEVLARRLAAEWGEIEVDVEEYGMTSSQRTRFDSDEELARRLAAEELSNADAAPQDNDATMDVLIETSSLPPRGVAEWRFL